MKINSESGFTHDLALVVVVVGMAIIGTYFLVASHAATLSKLVYVTSSSTTENTTIYAVNSDGTNNEELVSGVPAQFPVWNSTQSKIFYINDDVFTKNSTESCIFTYTLASKKSTNLNICVPQPGMYGLTYTAATNRLAFVKFPVSGSTSGTIYDVSASGKNLKELTSGNGTPGIFWSPSGDNLLYVNNSTGYYDSVGVNANNTPSSVVVIAKAYNGGDTLAGMFNYPWSSNGSQLTYVQSSGTSAAGVGIMNSNGTGQQLVNTLGNTALSEYYDPITATWSPNGSQIALVANGASAGSQDYFTKLFTMNTNGTNLQVINSFPETTNGPTIGSGFSGVVWSSESSAIAYEYAGGTTNDLYITSTTPGSTPILITTQNVLDLSWSGE